MANGKYVIGKMPGYNDSILPEPNKAGLYTNRLLKNLSMIEFIPTGYKMNAGGLLGDLVDIGKTLTDGKDNTTEQAISKTITDLTERIKNLYDALANSVEGNESWTQKFSNSIDELEKDASKSVSLTVTSFKATNQWSYLLKLGRTLKDTPNYNALVNGFMVFGTTDGTANEVISNHTEKNKIQAYAEGIGNSISQSSFGQAAGLLTGMYKSYTSDAGISMLAIQGKFGLLGALSGLVQGVKIELPKVWSNTDYSSTLNLNIKLVSPSGDPNSIQQYIKDPLEILLRAAAPVTFDGLTYGYPMIWNVNAYGIMHIKYGIINAINITRGGVETIYNKYDEPLNVDVRLVIVPINDGFAQGKMKDYSMTDPSDIIFSIGGVTDMSKDTSNIPNGPAEKDSINNLVAISKDIKKQTLFI
jgi:hypothetical protein